MRQTKPMSSGLYMVPQTDVPGIVDSPWEALFLLKSGWEVGLEGGGQSGRREGKGNCG